MSVYNMSIVAVNTLRSCRVADGENLAAETRGPGVQHLPCHTNSKHQELLQREPKKYAGNKELV